jgi:alkaline phosphatase
MKYFLMVVMTFALSGCRTQYQSAIPPASSSKKPKNIILMIGDGMGLTQISAGLYANKNKLNLELFPYIGLHKSYPAENGDLITDSAAGATAFAAGEKTYNAAIGVGVDSLPRKTILEMAEEHGLATGLIATCNIAHATPASFIAHIKKRDLYEDIAADFLKTNVDLIIGGGKKYFDRRADNRNLLTELQKKGYYVSNHTQEDLERMVFPESNVAYFTAEDHPVPAAQGRDYLPLASRLGCDFLKKRNPKGFFMMIEGSQIDWGGHAKNSDYIISEMQDFDQAIGQVLDFAKKDGNTLVIVTADHETGGYSINKGSKMGSIQGAFTTDYHTGCLIPVFAFGPGAENFAGMYENTAIFHKMKALFGF